MKLRDVVDDLPVLDEALCIVAKRPWSPACEVQVVPFTPEYRVPQSVLDSGYEYFLEVGTARDDVLKGMDFLSPEESVEVLLYYAEHDAFPEWLNELCRRRS